MKRIFAAVALALFVGCAQEPDVVVPAQVFRDTTAQIASQTNVMGVILNKCRYMDRDNAYDYYE